MPKVLDWYGDLDDIVSNQSACLMCKPRKSKERIALEQIADLPNKTQVRGGIFSLANGNEWDTIHPEMKLGFEIAAKIAKRALQ